MIQICLVELSRDKGGKAPVAADVQREHGAKKDL